VTVAVNGKPIPAAWFSKETPQLAEALQPNVVISRDGAGFKAAFREPQRLRKLKWVFSDYGERQLSSRTMTVTDAADKAIIPTEQDYTAGLNNETLEVAPGDKISSSYHDEKRLNANAPYLYAELDAAYNNGSIGMSVELADDDGDLRYYSVYRCRKGDTLMITVNDTDEDQSAERDKISVQVETSGGQTLTLEALETGEDEEADGIHTGMYQAVLKLGDKTEGNTIRLNEGQTLTVSYLDRENLDPGVPFSRTASVNEAGASVAELSVQPQYMTMQQDTSEAATELLARLSRKAYNKGRTDLEIWQKTMYVPPAPGDGEDAEAEPQPEPDEYQTSVELPLQVTVVHPAAALHAGSTFKSVRVVTEAELAAAKAEGREAKVREFECDLSSLENGVFGFSMEAETAPTVIEPLLVKGTDTLHVSITEGGRTVKKTVRLASDAVLEIMERSYTARSGTIHLGEQFYVRVRDLDRDATAERDTVTVAVAANSGASAKITLSETFGRSGVFEGRLKPVGKVAAVDAGLGEADAAAFQVTPGDTVTFTYTDAYRALPEAPESISVTGKIREGADGELAAFSKRFQDPEMAVKTSFLMAESLFEMAKDQRKLGNAKLAEERIAAGKRVLEEAIRDFPETELKAQGEFLLANLAEEMGNFEEAIRRYSGVLSTWPDSEHAAPALFKKALCLEKKGEPEQALEEYVRLTYIYKNSSLVADAVVRLASYYYKNKNYSASARIFSRFQENNPHHRLAAKSLALAGLSHMKDENAKMAMRCFEKVTIEYPDDKGVRAEAMYWLGNSAVEARDYPGAYRAFKQLTWDYPDSKWAKMARGRLTENVLLNQGSNE
jgi:TolA-binding protein